MPGDQLRLFQPQGRIGTLLPGVRAPKVPTRPGAATRAYKVQGVEILERRLERYIASYNRHARSKNPSFHGRHGAVNKRLRASGVEVRKIATGRYPRGRTKQLSKRGNWKVKVVRTRSKKTGEQTRSITGLVGAAKVAGSGYFSSVLVTRNKYIPYAHLVEYGEGPHWQKGERPELTKAGRKVWDDRFFGEIADILLKGLDDAIFSSR